MAVASARTNASQPRSLILVSESDQRRRPSAHGITSSGSGAYRWQGSWGGIVLEGGIYARWSAPIELCRRRGKGYCVRKWLTVEWECSSRRRCLALVDAIDSRYDSYHTGR